MNVLARLIKFERRKGIFDSTDGGINCKLCKLSAWKARRVKNAINLSLLVLHYYQISLPAKS